MKKAVFILLSILLAASLSGCLKDDYEALEKDIAKINKESDSLKDYIDELKEKNEKLSEQLKEASERKDELENESDSLYLTKEHIEEKKEITSDKGLGITKFEFEEAYFGLEELDDYFADLSISYLPYQYMADGGRVLKYYLDLESDYSGDFYIAILMCEDNEHIKEIYQFVQEDIVDNNRAIANKYLYAMCSSFVMAKEDIDDDFYVILESANIMMEKEPVYSDTVLFETSYDDGLYMAAIYDISEQ